MPKSVIDCLEPVEINKQHRQTLFAALRLGQRMGQLLIEHHPVRQFGQCIVGSDEFERLLRLTAPHVLSDLPADRLRCADQRFLGFMGAAVIKLHDPDHFAAAQQRKRKRAAQSRIPDQLRAQKSLLLCDIADPYRLT